MSALWANLEAKLSSESGPMREKWDPGTGLGVHLREVGMELRWLGRPLKERDLRGVCGLSGALCWGVGGTQVCGQAAGGNGARA